MLPILPTKGGLGVEAGAAGRHWAWQSSQPHYGSGGQAWEVKGWGLRVSAGVSRRPRSKEETAELHPCRS